MKRAIVNSPRNLRRYLADRVSIKLTQFTMKNVSARELFECGELFLCLQTEREQVLALFRLPLCLSARLFVLSRGDHIGC